MGERSLDPRGAAARQSDERGNADDPQKSEYVVPIEWVKTLPKEKAVWEKGMFANQHTACAPFETASPLSA